jgi:hypothetical protein
LQASAKMSCAGLGHCNCSHETKVTTAALRMEHKFDMWRLRSCKSTQTQATAPHASSSSSTHRPGNHVGHVAQRDLSADFAFAAILAVDVACGGRSRSFCHSQCPSVSRAGSKDRVQVSPKN